MSRVAGESRAIGECQEGKESGTGCLEQPMQSLYQSRFEFSSLKKLGKLDIGHHEALDFKMLKLCTELCYFDIVEATCVRAARIEHITC